MYFRSKSEEKIYDQMKKNKKLKGIKRMPDAHIIMGIVCMFDFLVCLLLVYCIICFVNFLRNIRAVASYELNQSVGCSNDRSGSKNDLTLETFFFPSQL